MSADDEAESAELEGAGYAPTPTDSTSEATLVEGDDFDTLVQSSTDYDAMLSAGAVDCGAARQLVERICYLATRVCALADRTVSDDALNASQCAEGRARCEDAEERLRGPCPGAR